MSSEDCIFCMIVAGQVPAVIIDEDERTLAFMDIAPATSGHSLVIPKHHASDLWEIEPAELAAVTAAAQRVALRMRDRLGADGVNLINSCRAQAWQTVFHFHIHVIPRYSGDPLRMPWHPQPVDLQEIQEVAQRLR
ncbi:MAG: HIT family protein [Solirubrobacteraceae bacterium]